MPQDQSDIAELVDAAVEVLADGKVTFGELVYLGGKLASKVNRLAHLSGKQKQALVLEAVELGLKQVLAQKKASLTPDEFVHFSEKIETAQMFVHETLPAVLDVAVQAARGQLDLGKSVAAGWSLTRVLCGCFGQKLPVAPSVKAVEAVAPPSLVKVLESVAPTPVAEAVKKVEDVVVAVAEVVEEAKQSPADEAPQKPAVEPAPPVVEETKPSEVPSVEATEAPLEPVQEEELKSQESAHQETAAQ
jgi:hypothetical protein